MQGCFGISCGREVNSKKHTQAFKKNYVLSMLIKSLLVAGLHEWSVLREVKWRSSVT